MEDFIPDVTGKAEENAEALQDLGNTGSTDDCGEITDVLQSPENSEIQENTETADEYHGEEKLIYINFTPPSDDENAFWDEVNSVNIKNSSKKVLWSVILVVILLCICGYSVMLLHGRGWFTNLFQDTEKINFTLPIAETPDLDEKYTNKDGSYTAAGVAKAMLSTVVQINVYGSNAFQAESQGSGIIMSEDGYIVTNAHVISSADYGITVMLNDKSEFSAKLVGKDDSSDIAVLKIGGAEFTAAQFADSDTCETGDEVVAIGSPAGFENSVTKGIISGLGRKIRAENSAAAMECIQIDAAINPGNSGGPLFNMWGQVIGITSSKLVSSSYDNIGFAITTNSAKPIIEEIIENGYAPDKARIGITFYQISRENAELYGIEAGMCVVAIDPDCDVANTDLKSGDIIVEVDGEKADDQNRVLDIVGEKKVGDKLKCRVFRPAEDKDDDGKPDGEGTYFDIEFKLVSDKTAMIEDNS